MRNIKVFILLFAVLTLWSCQPDEIGFSIKATIKGGEGKFIKIIDMTKPGLKTDSIELDLAGRFELSKVIYEPNDYVFYFNQEQSIRITPLPEQQIIVKGNARNLVKTYTVSGSPDSEIISKHLKKQLELKANLDSVRSFYMRNQLHPQIDSIIKVAKFRSDSIFKAGKNYLISEIESNPGSMSSYVALAQKLSYEMNYFVLSKDIKYFEMVDTALTNTYDTAVVARMMHAYVQRGQQQLKQQNQKSAVLETGQIAPEITLPNPYKDTLSLSELRGKYVLVDFWGSWCRPCRIEHPNLRRAYRIYKKKGFEIFQVALEQNKEDWKNTLREDKLYWKYQVSELNYMQSKVARLYKVQSIPSNYLIDPEGKIVGHNLYGENLLNELSRIFIEKEIQITE